MPARLHLALLLALAACRDEGQPPPSDLSLAHPAVAWSRNTGMPLDQGRAGVPLALAPTERRLIAFGGSPTASTDAVWSFSLRDDAWSTLQLGTAPPPGRTGHCAAYLPAQNQVLYVGGHDDDGTPRTTPMLLAVGTPGFVDVLGGAPTPLSGCAAAFFPRSSHALVFGGGFGPGPTDETWSLDPAGPAFTELLPAHRPPPRAGGALVADPGPDGDAATSRLVLFGGAGAIAELDDVWRFDDADWGELPTSGDPNAAGDSPRPLGRSGAAVALDPVRRLLYVFGGARQGVDLADLWRLDLRTLTWEELHAAGPTGRSDASAAWDPILDRMLIFGGRTNGRLLSDGWTLSAE